MSFSKALLGLAAVTVLSSLASAQGTLSCTAQPVDNPALRDNGVTERVGDLKIICTGGTSTPNGSPVPKFNLQIFTSPAVNITSRTLGGDLSEALLLMDEPAAATQLLCGSSTSPAGSAAGVCDILGTGSGAGVYSGVAGTAVTARPNAFVARQVGNTSLVWNGIPFDPPGTSGARIMRITNVRVNASQLNNVRGGATSVNIIISTTSSGVGNSIQVPIGNPAPTVGIAQTPLDFGASNASYLQCESQNFSGGAATPGTFPSSTLALTFTERFGSALRRRSAAVPTGDFSTVPDPAESNVLDSSQLFETESGFYKKTSGAWDLASTGFVFSGISTANLGLASSGTRLLARFKNLPSGAVVYYTNHSSLFQVSASTTVATGDINATLADANGGGVYSAQTPVTGFSATTAVSGAASAVWEVIRTNTNVTETVKVGLALSYGANTSNGLPTLGTATADGQIAPLSTTATASATAQIPRFVEDSANNGKNLFTINACRSNLLFPFIVNGSGYETGLAIANTTKDPFGTQSQTGACTIVFYGKSGTSDVCLTQPSKSITGGQVILWTLGGGGDVAATPNFTGYAIAQCNFQYGHGFAFITDTRVEKIAQGYLALVMDDPIGPARTKSKSETLGN